MYQQHILYAYRPVRGRLRQDQPAGQQREPRQSDVVQPQFGHPVQRQTLTPVRGTHHQRIVRRQHLQIANSTRVLNQPPAQQSEAHRHTGEPDPDQHPPAQPDIVSLCGQHLYQHRHARGRKQPYEQRHHQQRDQRGLAKQQTQRVLVAGDAAIKTRQQQYEEKGCEQRTHRLWQCIQEGDASHHNACNTAHDCTEHG